MRATMQRMNLDAAHRSWPLPDRPWAMHMVWHDLLFMHWPLPPSDIQPLIPPGLELDTFDGQAWIAVVPFFMSDIHARSMPPFPGLSRMAELNVRTYVTRDGKPGVYFFSLDAASVIAVTVARLTYHLPYFYAKMNVERRGNDVHYTSRRLYKEMQAEYLGVYAPTGDLYQSTPGNLDHFLTERYCLYTADTKGRILRGEIHHAPWPLQPAEAEVRINTMTLPLALELPDCPPLLHFARELEVVAWRLEAVDAPQA